MTWHRIGKRKISKTASNFISKKIAQLMDEGYPQQQAIAIAYSEARKKYPHAKGLKRYALNQTTSPLGKRHEMTHSEWEYYGGKYR